jgi:putative transcriptional regulator
MSDELVDLLPLHALGMLTADEAARVEHAAARDPALAAELAALRDAASVLIVPVAPPPAVKARLLTSVGGGAFDRFAARLAALYDVTADRARELLGLIERPASWTPTMPDIELLHFDGGPATAGADCGFVRLAPGATFPLHTHRGAEVCIVLSGRLRDQDGCEYGPGDEAVKSAGSEHFFVAAGPEPLLFAARVQDGIEIGGAPVRPGR